MEVSRDSRTVEDSRGEGSTGITRLCMDGQSKLGWGGILFDLGIVTICCLKSNSARWIERDCTAGLSSDSF